MNSPCPLLLILLVVSCGGPGAANTAASPEVGRPPVEEVQCLEDAQAPREPKAAAPSRIEVSHVLVRHKDLERPEGATRSQGEACLHALEALQRLEAGGEWDEVVGKYSDAGGATQGSLGTVSREDLDPQFADAAFALDQGELSYVVQTERGFHIILRER